MNARCHFAEEFTAMRQTGFALSNKDRKLLDERRSKGLHRGRG
jgi:hypothetical protein